MLIGEIVVTEHLLDIGLQVGYDEYGPRIRATYSKYSPNAYYGGAQFVKWIGTGKYVSEDDWNHHTDSSMSVQKVLDIYQIDKTKINFTKKDESIKMSSKQRDTKIETLTDKLQKLQEAIDDVVTELKSYKDVDEWVEIKKGKSGLLDINLPPSQEVVIINKRDDSGDNVNYDVVTGWFTGKFDGNEPIFVSGDEVLSYVRFWKPLPKPFVY